MTTSEARISPGDLVEQLREMMVDLTVDVSYVDHPAWSMNPRGQNLQEALTLVGEMTDKLADLRNELEQLL